MPQESVARATALHYVLSVPTALARLSLDGRWPTVACRKPKSKRSPLLGYYVCEGLAALLARAPVPKAAPTVPPSSQVIEGLIKNLCSIAASLTDDAATAKLEDVLSQLWAMERGLHSQASTSMRELGGRGVRYRGHVLVRALLLAGALRDSHKLREVISKSLRLAFQDDAVAETFLLQINSAAVPSAPTLSRWSFVVDVAFMAWPSAQRSSVPAS